MFNVATTRKEQRRPIAKFVAEPAGGRASFEQYADMPSSLHLEGIDYPTRPRGYALKRLLDIGASAAGLAFVSPLILAG